MAGLCHKGIQLSRCEGCFLRERTKKGDALICPEFVARTPFLVGHACEVIFLNDHTVRPYADGQTREFAKRGRDGHYPSNCHNCDTKRDFALVRLNADGSRDTSFGLLGNGIGYYWPVRRRELGKK
jgi:Domain of unknown function (DUF5122) beta-propeller